MGKKCVHQYVCSKKKKSPQYFAMNMICTLLFDHLYSTNSLAPVTSRIDVFTQLSQLILER